MFTQYIMIMNTFNTIGRLIHGHSSKLSPGPMHGFCSVWVPESTTTTYHHNFLSDVFYIFIINTATKYVIYLSGCFLYLYYQHSNQVCYLSIPMFFISLLSTQQYVIYLSRWKYIFNRGTKNRFCRNRRALYLKIYLLTLFR